MAETKHHGLEGDDRSTESGEDYLACIFELIEEKGYARVADVAKALSVAQPSACVMIKRLAQKGYLAREKYRGFTLTGTGQATTDAAKSVSVNKERKDRTEELSQPQTRTRGLSRESP